MSGNNKVRAHKSKWPGVYKYESQDPKRKARKDVCYYIRYKDAEGRLITEKVGWSSEGFTPQMADTLRGKRIRKVRHGEQVKTSKEIALERARCDRSIAEIADAYFKHKGKSLKGRTTDLNRYENHLKPILGKRRVSSLSQLDIARVQSKMGKKAPATKANALELLRRIINHGVKFNLCMPIDFTIVLPKKDNEVTEYLKPEEVKKLLEVLDVWPSRDVARMLRLALLTGMRRGEIFALDDSALHFHQELIVLSAPKGGKTVSIPMSKPAAEVLKEQLEWRDEKFPDSSYVFPGRKGARRVDCSAVDRIKAEAGIRMGFRIFHGLRHHFAVTLANSGEFSLDMIGELLTHKSVAMTKRYGQFLPDTKKQASNRAAELIGKSAQTGKVVGVNDK